MKTKNILFFLEYLTTNYKFCIKEIANILNVDTKTIQRYKKEIQEYFKIEFISYKRGCYQLADTKKLKAILLDPKDSDDFYKMIDILSLANSKFLAYLDLDKNIIKKLSANNIYILKDDPFEEFLKFEYLNILKEAIKYNKYVDIYYFDIIYKDVKVFKIVFAQNNWYIATLTNDDLNNGFKFLRINFIKDLKLHSKTFHNNIDVENFLNSFQTLFSGYLKQSFEVLVEVDKEVSRFFKVKKFLSSQKIIKEKENGNLIISYFITNDEEIIILAKRWLPYFKIISPKNLDEKFKNLIKKYL